MTTMYTPEQVIAIGGREWHTATKHRIYLNDWAAMVGVDVEYYRSGNICSAALNGKHISNTKAGKLLAGKVFWEAGTLWVQGVHDDIESLVAPAVAKAVAALAPADPAEIIAHLRAAGRTVREIAAAVGVHTSTVYRWARRLFRPAASRAAALATLAA